MKYWDTYLTITCFNRAKFIRLCSIDIHSYTILIHSASNKDDICDCGRGINRDFRNVSNTRKIITSQEKREASKYVVCQCDCTYVRTVEAHRPLARETLVLSARCGRPAKSFDLWQSVDDSRPAHSTWSAPFLNGPPVCRRRNKREPLPNTGCTTLESE